MTAMASAKAFARRLAGGCAIGLVAACGGQAGGALDHAVGQDAAVGMGAADVPDAPDSGSAGPLTGPSSGVQPGIVVGSDGGCTPAPSVLTLPAQDTPYPTCWGCIAQQGCSTQLAACAADCSCNAAMVQQFECAVGDAASCDPSAAASDDPTGAFICIEEASYECGCLPPPDASTTGCTQLGSTGSGGGSDQCTSTFGEVCAGTNYQVVCACPESSCVCFSGSSVTRTVPFTGCPACPDASGETSGGDMLTLCGFPR